ncbi:hypothetical protein [Streptomyces atratus]|uniref:hypothetical protein n=1 Tax=Streptomyces atratus TaxID=1893 RepID=UPI0033D9F860
MVRDQRPRPEPLSPLFAVLADRSQANLERVEEACRAYDAPDATGAVTGRRSRASVWRRRSSF